MTSKFRVRGFVDTSAHFVRIKAGYVFERETPEEVDASHDHSSALRYLAGRIVQVGSQGVQGSHRLNRRMVAPGAAASAVKYDDPDSSSDKDGSEDDGFQRPFSSAEQPWTWIPRDKPVGLSQYFG
ncbi:hypothetical protein BU17DRAFT_79553 [Hysterangium stoloniferum]|nr:hypothetical protein BU17DRAFT_79553 [Hysterangium stoloniferum]